jgi:hypothetical protein
VASAVGIKRSSDVDGRSRPTKIILELFSLGRFRRVIWPLDEARSAVLTGLALNPAFSISRARAAWTPMSDDPT